MPANNRSTYDAHLWYLTLLSFDGWREVIMVFTSQERHFSVPNNEQLGIRVRGSLSFSKKEVHPTANSLHMEAHGGNTGVCHHNHYHSSLSCNQLLVRVPVREIPLLKSTVHGTKLTKQ